MASCPMESFGASAHQHHKSSPKMLVHIPPEDICTYIYIYIMCMYIYIYNMYIYIYNVYIYICIYVRDICVSIAGIQDEVILIMIIAWHRTSNVW